MLPSTKEGFGIVYLEAWKHGLPVICSDRGASKEIVDDGVDGYIVNHSDIATLASRMDLFLREPARAAAMGHAGAMKVTERYLNANFQRNLASLVVGPVD